MKTISIIIITLLVSLQANATWYELGNNHSKKKALVGMQLYHDVNGTTETSVLDVRDCGRWSPVQKNDDTSMTVDIQRCTTTNPNTCADDTDAGTLTAAAWDFAYQFSTFMRLDYTSATSDRIWYTCVKGGE